MSVVGKEITLTIDRLAGLGEGCGIWEGRKVFVPHTLAGERVKAVIVHETSDFLRARLLEVEVPAEGRSEAFCPHFTECGGCSLQHMNEKDYLDFKRQMVLEAVRKAGFEGVKPEPLLEIGQGRRRRVDFTVLQKDGDVVLGFQAQKSHDVVDANECRVLVPPLQQLMHPLRAALKKLNLAAHIESIQVLYLGSLIDVGVVPVGVEDPAFEGSLVALGNALGASRISVQRPMGPKILMEKRSITRTVDGMAIDIPPFCFLQASEAAEQRMVDEVTRGLRGCHRIADLFCGMGTFSLPLTLHAQVIGFESVPWMVESLQHSARVHSMQRRLTIHKRDLFMSPLMPHELDVYDGIVINPPRNGAKEQCAQIAASGIRKLIMISCNPASFARDARILREGGFRLTRILGIDQFAYSSHLELVAHFVRP